MTLNAKTPPTKLHRMVGELYPEQQAAVEQAKKVFFARERVEAKDRDIVDQGCAAFCARQGVTYPHRLNLRAQGGRRPDTEKRERITKLIADHPDWTNARIARDVPCRRDTVRSIRERAARSAGGQ
jgi:hypothetical protein